METNTQQPPATEKKANLAVVNAMPISAGVIPTTFDQLVELTKIFAASALVPKALQKSPADVMVVLMKGLELGLKPMQALSEIHVIDGKAGCSAKLKLALVLQSGVCEYFNLDESTATKATFTTKRLGKKPVTMSFTWADAERAKLTHKDNWQKYPAAMLRARCESQICDLEYADITQGVLTTDELREVHERVVGSGQTPAASGRPTVGATVAPPSPPQSDQVDPEEDLSWMQPPAPKEDPKAEPRQSPPPVDEPRPTPPASNEPTELEKVLVLIGEATELAHLEALSGRVGQLSKSDRLLMKKAYTDRRDEILKTPKGAA